MSDLATMVADVRTHAAALHNAWDRRAIDWPLDENSVVVEVGGYTGRWALQIAERYHPRLYVFEPQDWAADVCQEVLWRRAEVYRCALGDHDGDVIMGRWGTDGCSLLIEGGEPAVRMREIAAAFRELEIDHIDLMMMNIEGYEYVLIPHMLSQDILPDRLIVQFHPQTIGDARTAIVYDLLEAYGYRIAWDYGIVLTAWERI